jgi:hypothetical protein
VLAILLILSLTANPHQLGTYPQPYRNEAHPCVKLLPLAEQQNPKPTVQI